MRQLSWLHPNWHSTPLPLPQPRRSCWAANPAVRKWQRLQLSPGGRWWLTRQTHPAAVRRWRPWPKHGALRLLCTLWRRCTVLCCAVLRCAALHNEHISPLCCLACCCGGALPAASTVTNLSMCCSSEIEGALGRVEDAPLLALSQQHAALLRWQQQLNPAGSSELPPPQQQAKGKAPPPGFGSGKAPAVAPMAVAAGPLPAVQTLSLEEAVLAVCGMDAETAAAAYAAAAGEALDSSAARAALAAALTPKPPPRVATAAEQAAVEAEVFGAKGRVLNAEAGARWLIQWCSKVTGGATGGDDTVATAVCRLLLSGGCRLSQLLGCWAEWDGLDSFRAAGSSNRVTNIKHRMCTCPSAARSDDEIAAELFDLLGDSVFEHIGK